jgi:hypothetical protein
MTLWDTVMIAVVIGSTILFCFWATAKSRFLLQSCSAKMSRGSR